MKHSNIQRHNKPLPTLAVILVLFLLCKAVVFSAEPTVLELNIRDLGARGDGTNYDTKPIQQAINMCATNGGGTVRFPPGVYLCQPIKLCNNLKLILEEGTTLLASRNHQHFMKQPGNWLEAKSNNDFIPLISAENAENIHISGSGTIDGSGEVWWDAAEEARRKTPGYTLPRPNLISFVKCRNISIKGITIQNSPKFHVVPLECENVLIEGVKILAPHHTPNTDGIDPSLSVNVIIRNCLIDVGDDNIAIKSGRKLSTREWGCENILVENCHFKYGHGMSIGSETVGGVRNVIVRNCTFENTENGIRIKSARGRGGVVNGLYCENIYMTNVERAITLTCYYPRIPTNDLPQPFTNTTPAYTDIVIKNLTATCYENAGLIVGLPESPIKNVTLENITIRSRTTGLEIRNADGIILHNVTIQPGRGLPIITNNAAVSLK